MTTLQEDKTNPSSSTEQFVESPFPSQKAFTSYEADSEQPNEEAFYTNSLLAESPFPSVFETDYEGSGTDPETEEMVAFLSELNDQEFDEAVFEIINEADGLLQNRFEAENADPMAKAIAGTRLLEAHAQPLVRELEMYLDNFAQELEQYNIESMTEAEFNEIIDRYEPTNQSLSPAFENFLKKIRKKFNKAIKKGFRAVKRGVKSVAKRAIKIASTVGSYALKGLKAISGVALLQALLKKLKRLVKPLLKNVLDRAINRLPAMYQPVARTLRDKMLSSGALRNMEYLEGNSNYEFEWEAAQDINTIQRELDNQIAYLVYADSEDAQEAALGEYETKADQLTAENTLETLDQARDRFVNQITELEEGEDPTPALENFIPAILPAIKVGIKLYGRSKVIRKLANYVAKLIQRFVGKKYTPFLSQAIVDAGMRMIHLEATPQDETKAAGNAIAATVEETVRQVAALPEYILADESMVEGFIMEAFEQAAAANLPQVLSENVYETRPELRETSSIKGTWLMQPLRGRKRYKKFSRIFDVKISPYAARTLKTFRGLPLGSFLRNRYRLLPGRNVKARVHLYEAIPGTTLNDIVRSESTGPLMNMESIQGYSPLHPLTSEAAGVLLGEPGLGNKETLPSEVQSSTPNVGQRYYFLEISEAPTQPVSITSGKNQVARPCQFALTLDFTADQITAFIFISEADSQSMAAKLRQRAPVGTVLTGLQKSIEIGVKSALSARSNGSVKIIHGTLPPEQSRGLAFKWLPPIVLETLAAKLIEWLGQHLAQLFQQRHQEFITATENLEDGVTIIVKLNNPPGFNAVAKVLRGEAVSLQKIGFTEGLPNVSSKIVPGLARD
jgi:hypothetical protein